MYNYIKLKKHTTTYMQIAPQQMLVESHLEGLGFKVTDKRKKNATILLQGKKEDLR